jgi:hypothetical protein
MMYVGEYPRSSYNVMHTPSLPVSFSAVIAISDVRDTVLEVPTPKALLTLMIVGVDGMSTAATQCLVFALDSPGLRWYAFEGDISSECRNAGSPERPRTHS